MLGSSPQLTRLLDLASRMVGIGESLFLYGESGTGKDMLARAIHDAGTDEPVPFVMLNAGAMPADLLERELAGPASEGGAPYPHVPRYLMLSRQGTLYLDDICRMPERCQARLVDFLDRRSILLHDGSEAPWEGRIIAASNADPRAAISGGRFRRDLYDMLASSYLALPPLRQRNGDPARIATALFPQFLEELDLPQVDLPQRVLAQIDALPWPGNCRQLRNTLRRMALTPEAADGQSPELPPDVRADAYPAGLDAETLTFAEIERRAILAAIERNEGSIPRASAELALAASTIYRKLRSWNL